MGKRTFPAVPGYALAYVWASAGNVPLKVCRDARLREGTEYTDKIYGEFGNNWGVGFSSFRNLVDTLKGTKTPEYLCGNWVRDCDPLPKGYLKTLKINAHGAPGFVDIECKSTHFAGVVDPNLKIDGLEVATLSKYSYEFQVLDDLLHPNGDLIFMCCLTGQGPRGTEFVTEVSKLVPGRDVTTFATVGYSDGAKQMRKGEGCNEPGMRDTDNLWPSPTAQLEEKRYLIGPDGTGATSIWNDLGKLPWADPGSPHAKIARDGKIIGGRGRNL